MKVLWILVALLALGAAAVFAKELPAMRRYLNIERM